jgi:hypothetical protein
MAVKLIRPIFGDCDGGGGIHTAPAGSPDLTIGEIRLDRYAPYRIDLKGETIGWAPPSSVRPRGISKPMVGLIVIVKK